MCQYPSDMFQCANGKWQQLCMGTCAPPLSEACDQPFPDVLADATLQVGHVDGAGFSSYADGQPIDVIWGGQGAAMLAYRLRISAPVNAPTCVLTETTLSVGGQSTLPSKLPVTLRCTDSLAVYAMAPVEFFACAPGEQVPITLKVKVAGVGEKTFALTVDAGISCSTFDGDGGPGGDGGLDAAD
jgi:hypothetical protein